MSNLTMSDIEEHPEKMDEQDQKDLREAFNSVRELGKSLAGYHVKINNNNSQQILAENFYEEFFVEYAILEAFEDKNVVSFRDINQSIVNKVPSYFPHVLRPSFTNKLILKMIRYGYIKPIESSDKNMPMFAILDDGISVLKAQTFQTLALTSFYGKSTFDDNKSNKKLSKRMYRLTILMLIATVVSISVAVLSLFLM